MAANQPRLTWRARLARWLLKGADDSALYRLHPELRSRAHLVSLTSADQAAPDAGIDYADAADLYAAHVWVYRCIDVLANNFAPLPVCVVDSDGKVVKAHPVTALLDYVNPQQAPADLWRQWMVDMMLAGEEGWEMVKSKRGQEYVEIWPRQPHRVTVIAERGAEDYYRPAAYLYRAQTDRELKFPPDEFVFYRFFNPRNPWRGLSPIGAALVGIRIDQYVQAWGFNSFQRGARPDFALIAPQGITPSEKDRMAFDFESRYMGWENMGKPPILEQGITDVKVFSWPPKDVEWVQQREMSRDEVAAIFGVPPEIAGFGKDTYENFAKAEQVLFNEQIVPLAGFRDSVLTEWFGALGLLKPGERIDTDFSDVAALKEDKAGDYQAAVSFMQQGVPFNVVNDHFQLGFPALPGGDVGYISVALRPALASPGRPAPEIPPAIAPAAQMAATPETRGNGHITKRARTKAAPAFGSDAHAALWGAKQARLDPVADDFKRAVKRELQRQQNEIARRLRGQADYDLPLGERLGRGNWKGQAAAGIDLKAATSSVLFDLRDEAKKWEQVFEQYFVVAFREVGQAELTAILRDLDFNMESPDVVVALKHQLEAFALKLNDTTWTELTDIFQEAEANGESIQQISERLSAYYGDRKSDWQLERIARTTLNGAQSAASVLAYRQTEGVVQGMQWLSALKKETRPWHAAAHGQFRRLGEAFDIGGEALQYPGDPGGSASNIINCLCAVVPVVAEVGPDEELVPPENANMTVRPYEGGGNGTNP